MLVSHILLACSYLHRGIPTILVFYIYQSPYKAPQLFNNFVVLMNFAPFFFSPTHRDLYLLDRCRLCYSSISHPSTNCLVFSAKATRDQLHIKAKTKVHSPNLPLHHHALGELVLSFTDHSYLSASLYSNRSFLSATYNRHDRHVCVDHFPQTREHSLPTSVFDYNS